MKIIPARMTPPKGRNCNQARPIKRPYTLGVQIIGPRFEDYTPLEFAGLLESTLGLNFQAPRLATDITA